MGVGRFFCVALPFILTVASIVCLLIAGLSGVASNSLYMFEVNMTDLEIDPATISSLINKLNGRDLIARDTPWHDGGLLEDESSSGSGSGSGSGSISSNLTLTDFPNLYNIYDVNVWSYCYTASNGTRTCSKPAFDWASSALNTTGLVTSGGASIVLPKEVTDALNVFKSITKWTQVVFIIALVALGVELLFGLFTSCSRVVSCITWLVSGIATVAVIAAAGMMTAMAVLVVGTVEGTAKWYGVTSKFNTGFLAVIWLSAAFALAAGLFWMFTICCCKPEHRHHSRRNHDEAEKFLPTGAYAPLHENHGYNAQYGVPRHQSSGPRSDLAYEPYSHSNV